ncbi:MAG: hypothetical protein NTX06_08935 [Proteobacteria bacterium]|nr:hypothetical protein [Pseudomonadota bacterium]
MDCGFFAATCAVPAQNKTADTQIRMEIFRSQCNRETARNSLLGTVKILVNKNVILRPLRYKNYPIMIMITQSLAYPQQIKMVPTAIMNGI